MSNKRALIQMTRKESFAVEPLWDCLLKIADLTKLPLCSEANFGVRDRFELSFQPNVDSRVQMQLPLVVPLLLSDKQLECYLLHNFLLHLERDRNKSWRSKDKITQECIKHADKVTSAHCEPEFVMGTLIKAAIVECAWLAIIESETGRLQMGFQSGTMIDDFIKVNCPTNKTAYSAAMKNYDATLSGGLSLSCISFKSRIELLGLTPAKCFESSINEPTSTVFDLSNKELRIMIDSVLNQQAILDANNKRPLAKVS